MNSKKGTVFWVTGLPGSGKTTIAKKLEPFISKKYGPSIVISGDDIRTIFRLNSYTKRGRFNTVKKYSLLAKFFSDQGLNVIFAVVGLFHKVHTWNRKNIKNYIEIFIDSEIDTLKKKKKKFFYKKKTKNVVGIDIKPEIPKKPDIVIKNNFNQSINQLVKKILKKI